MNKIKTSALILCLAAALTACGNDSTAEVTDTESDMPSEEVTFGTDEPDISVTESDTSAASESDNVSDSSTETVTENSGDDEPEAVYDNNMETNCFIPEKDGRYKIKHTGNDNIPWQVYILDEEFTDGLRYLYSNYEPDGVTECTVTLKSGQYVYLICKDNEWNSASFADTQAEIYYIGE